MNDTDKLLRALIDALGFDVTKTTEFDYQKHKKHCLSLNRMYVLESGSAAYLIDDNDMYTSRLKEPIIDYKLTKREHPLKALGDGSTLYDFIKEHKEDLCSGTMMFTVFGVSHIPLNSFADYKELIVNPNPVIADCFGEFPEVWIRPPYRVTINNRQGKFMFEKDIDENTKN